MNYKFIMRCFITLLSISAATAFALEYARIGQQTDMEHLMPLYEIWVLERMCSKPRYRTEIGQSRMSCIRSVRDVLPPCSAEYRKKIPRNDSKEIGERLRYRDFMAGYTRCLKARYQQRDHAGGRRQ